MLELLQWQCFVLDKKADLLQSELSCCCILSLPRLLLSEFGGDLIIDKGWAKSFMRRHRSCALIPQATSVKENDGLPFNSNTIEENSEDDAASDVETDRSGAFII